MCKVPGLAADTGRKAMGDDKEKEKEEKKDEEAISLSYSLFNSGEKVITQKTVTHNGVFSEVFISHCFLVILPEFFFPKSCYDIVQMYNIEILSCWEGCL